MVRYYNLLMIVCNVAAAVFLTKSFIYLRFVNLFVAGMLAGIELTLYLQRRFRE